MTRLASALACALILRAVSAHGHSILLESSPPAGATVAAPARVSLRFNNRVEKSLSRIRLLDTRGQARPLDPVIAEEPVDRLTAVLPAVAPGAYRVEWQILSTDGHVVRGSFPLTIAP